MRAVESHEWLFDEAGHAGREHLDPASVALYDVKARVDPSEDLERLERLGLDADSTLIDLGAGTGAFALAAAPRCRRVVAVDASKAMLAVLRTRADELERTNIECVEAGFLTYRHDGEPADFVYSRNALHHLPDFWKAVALRRLATFVRPGGTLLLRDLVYSFDPADADIRLSEWLEGAATRPEEGWTRRELEAHVRDEHSTFSWLLEPMLERAGFDIGERTYVRGFYGRYVCTRRG